MRRTTWGRRATGGRETGLRGDRRPLLFALLAAALLAPAAPAAPQEPPPEVEAAPVDQAPAAEPERPPEISFEELLAAEEAAAAAQAEAAARRLSRLPFQARSRPLQGLPAGMAALIMGARPGGQVVSSVLALPLGRAVAPPPPPPPPAADDDAAPAAPAAPAESGPPREVVVLFVEIDGPSLLGPAPGETAQLEVFAYALAPNGSVRGFLSQRLPLDLAETGEALFAGGVKLVGHLELPPGEYVLRVLVHEAASQRFGLRAVPLNVPAGAALSPPLAAEPTAAATGAATPWLLVVESPHGTFGAVDFGEVLHQAGTPLPSALPVLPGDDAELDVLVTRGAAVGERLAARLLDTRGETAANLQAEVLARRATDLPGFDRLRVRLPLDEVDVGSYFLTLAGEVDGRPVESAELPLVVTRDAGGGVLWTDIERRLSGGEVRAEVDLQSGGRRGRRNERAERAVTAAYRAVLERLATGDRDGAAADLARIEDEVLAGVPEDPFTVLTAAQDGVLSALAAADAEALLPVALLHADVYRRQRETNSFGLATRSRSQSVAAAERYAAASGVDEAESFASGVLAMIGDELQRAQVRRSARDLLERATALDSDNRFALLHLAAGLEKVADYAGAAAVLRRLISVDPKAPEGRLRLAINLLRLGQAAEATTLLGRLIGEDNPDWVLSLAYQTLAAERLRGGDAAGAAEVLRRGTARLPREQRLLLQLAYALERAGRAGEAGDVVARLDGIGVGGPSPRHQYHLWPEGGRDELERRLVQAGLVRLPRLTGALAKLPRGGLAMRPTRTSPRRAPAVAAALAALAVALPAAAIDVLVTSPRPQTGVFGTVTIEAEVLSTAPIVEVVFRVDGEVVGRRGEPPWRLTVDIGQQNVPHTFEVVARDASGETATGRVVTRTIAVDEAVDLELQQLYVTVTRAGERVLDLPRQAFSVLDEGDRQELVTFEGGDVPLVAALLVDTSLSMRGARIRAALEGARAFVAGMRQLDEASLMLFSDRLLHSTPFTSDAATIARGLDAVEADGGTALNDHLYAALKRLDREQGRRVVVLLSDGTDVESVLSIEDVLWKARRSQALVYWIRLRDAEGGQVVSRTSAWRDMAGHERERTGLAQVVQESGGRIVDLARIEDAPAAFRDILAELREQYVLGYYPSANLNDGRWHRVQVRVDGFGLSVRAREGYVDF